MMTVDELDEVSVSPSSFLSLSLSLPVVLTVRPGSVGKRAWNRFSGGGDESGLGGDDRGQGGAGVTDQWLRATAHKSKSLCHAARSNDCQK